MSNWWERPGNRIAYPAETQGSHPHCVYAAIAGAVNHLVQRPVWTTKSLFEEHQKNGPRHADFGVADTAITPVSESVTKLHHNSTWSQARLSSAQIGEWINAGAVVILSMELRNANPRSWHMFSLVAVDQGTFQVWDTNKFEGFMTAAEIERGFSYPDGRFFVRHAEEDTLVLYPQGCTLKGDDE
jgi:hypothetical protein